MIKINLFPTFETVEGTPIQQYGVLLFVLGVVAMGGWYLNATSGRADLEEQVNLLEVRSAELKVITAEVVAFEAQKSLWRSASPLLNGCRPIKRGRSS